MNSGIQTSSARPGARAVEFLDAGGPRFSRTLRARSISRHFLSPAEHVEDFGFRGTPPVSVAIDHRTVVGPAVEIPRWRSPRLTANAQRTAGSGPAGPGIGESQVWADAVARSCFGARAGTQARRRDSPASRDTRPAARTGTIGRQRHAPGLLASGGSRASAGAQGAGDGA